jgi:CAAX prenyl protease-like protein
MKTLAGYLVNFAKETNRKLFVAISVYTAIFVALNYSLHIERQLLKLQHKPYSFAGFFLLYLLVFGGCYLAVFHWNSKAPADKNSRTSFSSPGITSAMKKGSLSFSGINTYFCVLVLAATIYFAWRMSSGIVTAHFITASDIRWNRFWAAIANPPFKCVVLFVILYYVSKSGDYKSSINGLQKQAPSLRPFIILLLVFAPIIFLIASQPDFLHTYPRFRSLDKLLPAHSRTWATAAAFELSYAFDFVTAEVFFRGFLVLAFVRYAGAAAILPMAAFYCAIHFGKPLAECISSYFGGIILGVITYRTGSVSGGLLLHLGMGWLMEVAGFVYGG